MYFVKKSCYQKTFYQFYSGSFSVHFVKLLIFFLRCPQKNLVLPYAGGGLRTLRICPQLIFFWRLPLPSLVFLRSPSISSSSAPAPLGLETISPKNYKKFLFSLFRQLFKSLTVFKRSGMGSDGLNQDVLRFPRFASVTQIL